MTLRVIDLKFNDTGGFEWPDVVADLAVITQRWGADACLLSGRG